MPATATKEPRREAAATRNTVQRALVMEAVQALHHHPTPADVYDMVHEHHPNVSRATVYRNLNLLAQRGDILRVEVPNAADRYDYQLHPHYHAKCRCCGGVFDIDMPYQAELETLVQEKSGFTVEHHDIVFEGVCAGCAENSACA